MRTDLYILGSSGQAREIHAYAHQYNRVDMVSEKNEPAFLSSFEGGEIPYIIGVGDPKIKRAIKEKLREKNITNSFGVLLADQNIAREYGLMTGSGVVISLGVTITTNVFIMDDTIINCGVNIGHDVTIGTGCQINPGAAISGKVAIGDYCLIGAGAIVLENLKVGRNSIVGAGAVVTKDVGENEVVVGIPARGIRN